MEKHEEEEKKEQEQEDRKEVDLGERDIAPQNQVDNQK